MVSVEYAEQLSSIKVPTLIIVGDHDECDPSLSKDMNARIPGSKLVVLPESGHMTFVDQPRMFVGAVQSFLSDASDRRNQNREEPNRDRFKQMRSTAPAETGGG